MALAQGYGDPKKAASKVKAKMRQGKSRPAPNHVHNSAHNSSHK